MNRPIHHKSSALLPANSTKSATGYTGRKPLPKRLGLASSVWVIAMILLFGCWSTYHFFADEVAVWVTRGAIVETAIGPQYFAQPFSWSTYAEHVIRGADTGFWLSWKYCAALIGLGSLLAVVHFLLPLYKSLRARGAIGAVGSVFFVLTMVALAGPLQVALARGAAESLVNQRIDAFEKELLSGGFSRCGTVYGVDVSGRPIQAELYQLGCSEIILDTATEDLYTPFSALERDKTLQSITLVEDLRLCNSLAFSGKTAAAAKLQNPTRQMVLAHQCQNAEFYSDFKRPTTQPLITVEPGL